MTKFGGKILVVGCGGVSQCTLPLILKLIDVPPQNVTVLDFVDNRARVKDVLKHGVNYAQDKLTRDNYRELLPRYLSAGDVFVDLAWDIDTCEMLDFCRKSGFLYINTSFELWSAYHGAEGKHPTELTLYTRQMALRKMIAGWGDNAGTTAVIDHGANPGLVSHFTKQALIDITNKILADKPQDVRRAELEAAIREKNFPKLAWLTGTKTIHISERDSQITNHPKEVNEFVNTWSVIGFIEEGIAPSELGWGTHERWIPKGAMTHKSGPKNQICLSSKGMNTWVRSWVPSGEITGMVIRHGEAFSISDTLTLRDGDGALIYRPTVHYAYCPSDPAINSMHELEMRQYVPQERQRILSDDITSGKDELGCLLMGHDFKSWWIGSLLDIEETRRLVPHQNATTLQVAISVVAALAWMIRNPRRGVLTPDHLDYDEILEVAKPYLGPFISRPVDWTPLMRTNAYLDYGAKLPPEEDVWQFTTFLVSHKEKEPLSKSFHEEQRITR